MTDNYFNALDTFRKSDLMKKFIEINQIKKSDLNRSVIVYHYCRAEDWDGIVEGSYLSENKPGLGASYRWCSSPDLEEFKTGAVFVFLEPLPENWMNNEYFGKLAWQTNKMGKVLLKVQIDVEKDNAYVCDRAYKEGFYYENKTGIPQKYVFHSLIEAEKAYADNKITLKEYIKNKDKYNFSMPEVVILHNIPIERLKVAEIQPVLEASLNAFKGKIPKSALYDVRKILGLKEWYLDYKKRASFEIIEEKQFNFSML